MPITIVSDTGGQAPRTRDFRYTDQERRVIARCLEIAASMLEALEESEDRIAELNVLRDDLLLGLAVERPA